jgi:Holliday junction resolvase RusA-like endonuclease
MLKLVLDGLNKVAWADDVQVTEVSARKALALPGQARTEVAVYRPGPDALGDAA